MNIRAIAAYSRIFWGKLSFVELARVLGRARCENQTNISTCGSRSRVAQDICDCRLTVRITDETLPKAGLVEVEGDAPTPDNHIRVIEALEHPRIVGIAADHIAGRLDRLA